MFCPGPGKTLPDDVACDQPMSEEHCTFCIPDDDRRLDDAGPHPRPTGRNQTAAQTIVLSHYMADALTQVGAPAPTVIPPPVHVDTLEADAGENFLLAGRLVQHKGIDIAIAPFRWRDHRASCVSPGLGSEDHRGRRERPAGSTVTHCVQSSAARVHSSSPRAGKSPLGLWVWRRLLWELR